MLWIFLQYYELINAIEKYENIQCIFIENVSNELK